MQCLSQNSSVIFMFLTCTHRHIHTQTYTDIQKSTHPDTGSHGNIQKPAHHITILQLPRLLLLWQPDHHVQPSRGRKRENGNTHSEAGAFLIRAVPLMAVPSPLYRCLVLSCLSIFFLWLCHILEDRETACPSCRISQALGGSEWWASPPTRLQQERENVE